MKTWVRVPPALRDLRKDGVQSLARSAPLRRLPLHWGMTMAAYPFWRVVADVTGRLFRLQGTAAPMQVQRRVKELLGEREAVARSARYVLRAFADWGVIVESSRKRSVFASACRFQMVDPKLAVWLSGVCRCFDSGRSLRTFAAWSMGHPAVSLPARSSLFLSSSQSRVGWKSSAMA